MSSTFYGLEIAKTGLFASQRGIDLTGHNISNANSTGYTRQRLTVSAKELSAGAERFSQMMAGYTGTGVQVDGIEQIRNVFLDRQYRSEYGRQQQWSTRADTLSYVEDLFNEVGDTGISASISNFFSSVQKLTMNPESKEFRTNVYQNALTLTQDFNHLASQLMDKQYEQDEAVRVTALQINDIAQGIDDLNNQIFKFEITGERANDLRDSRNNLLDELSGIVDISYTEDVDGKVSVSLGGHALVSTTGANLVLANATQVNPIAGGNALYALTWADATAVNVSSGELKAYLDLRDGNTAGNMGIPYVMSNLDTLASTIATSFNAIHNGGYSLPDVSNGNVSANNIDFFDETTAVTAANMDLSAAIKLSVFNIAAAGAQVTDDTLRGDNVNAVKLAELINKTDIPLVGSIEGCLKILAAEIGVEAAHSNKMTESENTLLNNLINQRDSISAVSLDEEMTSLIKYQHSYAASSRVITTIDEYLDVLINRMGRVGL